MRQIFVAVLGVLLVCGWGGGVLASYKDEVGFTQLQSELGGAMPTGAGVKVSLVEADGDGNPNNDSWAYMPNPGFSEFSGKTITPMLGSPPTPPYPYSGHALVVGQYFFGNSTSMAPGITQIDSYLADHWLNSGFLQVGYTPQPLSSTSRIGNHSWVGSYNETAYNAEALRRLDWLINRDEYVQAVAMHNYPSSVALYRNSFNAITVGRNIGGHATGSTNIDSVYTAGRTRPDIVGLENFDSYTTPQIAAATALLVETGHNGGTTLSKDPLVNSTTNRAGATIYNAERSEVVKAALMAGANRNSATLSGGYTVNTTNGLNATYGAGLFNIYNSYHIIAAGEQNSLEDAPAGLGRINRYGFDYDPYFGGISGSNRTASYKFSTQTAGTFWTALAWNIEINGGTPEVFDGAAILRNLDLYLYDVTDPLHPLLRASSASTLDNTENIWTSLDSGRDYLLSVLLGSGQEDFLWDYALAWQMTPVPLPGSLWLLGAGLLGVVGFRKRFSQ